MSTTLECPACKRPFSVSTSAASRRRCCSRDCYAKYRAAVFVGERNPAWVGGGSVEKTCEQCGSAFRVWPKLAKTRRFCSRGCRAAGMVGALAGDRHPRWQGGRKLHNGHIQVLLPGHPRADKNGYVYEHIAIAERAIGKSLPRLAVVHHINGDGADNRNCNLVICQNQSYHTLLHARQRALRRSA